MEKLKLINLPKPLLKGKISLEETIFKRRTHRAFNNSPLTLKEVSQLLFSGQGITDKGFYRTVPSAGALFPIEAYLVSGNVQGIPQGIYRYQPKTHQLIKVLSGDKRKELFDATFFQFWIEEAPAAIVLTGTPWKTMIKYGWRGKAFVLMEIGHSAQNISLQTIPLGLGTVCIGGFNKRKVKNILKLKKAETPLYILPIGRVPKNSRKKEMQVLERQKQAMKEFFSSKKSQS